MLKPVMPVIDIHHYNLRAHRPLLDELRDFYVTVLGLSIGDRPPFASFGYWLYAREQAIVHLTEAMPGELRLATPQGILDHVALSCEAPEQFIRALDDRGISYRVTRVPTTGERQIFFKDPAGNGVELNFSAAQSSADTSRRHTSRSALAEPVHVRKLTTADAQPFHALRLAALQESPSAYGSSHEEESAFTAAQVESRLAEHPDRGVFGAFDGDVLVGLVALGREGMRKLRHKGMVFGMYVIPALRGQGIGRALLNEVIDLAASVPELRQLNLSVNANNAAAIALYESCGFQIFGREVGALLCDGTLHDELHMIRRLSGSGSHCLT